MLGIRTVFIARRLVNMTRSNHVKAVNAFQVNKVKWLSSATSSIEDAETPTRNKKKVETKGSEVKSAESKKDKGGKERKKAAAQQVSEANNERVEGDKKEEMSEPQLNATDVVSNSDDRTKPRESAAALTDATPVAGIKIAKKEKNPITTPYQAVVTLKTTNKKRNFDESLELAMNLTIDTRKQDEQLRVVADLPNGTGKKTRVVAFTTDPQQAQAALEAGCDVVGGEDIIAEIARTQQVNFDKAVATPEIVASLAKVARLLGPRGLMPSKKLGTVVTDLAKAVQRAKAGSIELRADRAGTVHCGFGKFSMSDDALMDNLKAVIMCIENNKPPGVKGKRWVKTAFITSSMGPSHPINLIYLDPKNVRFMSKD